MDYIEKLKKEIASNKTKDAINNLQKKVWEFYTSNKNQDVEEIINSLVMISSNYNGLNKDLTNGIISSEDARLQKNRINNSFLSIIDNIKTENPQIIEYLSSGSYISKITTMPVNKLDNINITDVSIKEITNDDSTIILTSNSNYYATLEAKARYDMKQIIGNNPWGKVFGTGIGKRRDVEGTFIKGQRLEILKQDKDSLNDLYYLVLHPKKKNEKYWIPVISTTQFDPRLIFELKTGPYSFIGHIIFNMRAPNSYSDGSFNELKADYNFIGEQNLDLSDCYIIVFNHNTVKVILKKGEEENKIEEYDGIIKKDNCWLITDNSNIQLNLPEKKFELIRLNAVK